jgi:enoyl-CoA hydratase/carnithine racemase
VSGSSDANDVLLVDNVGRVRVLTLNRPDKANAFNIALYQAATSALQTAAEDDGVSVVLFTGAGRVFSGGVDIHDMMAVTPAAETTSDDIDRGDAGRVFDAFVGTLAAYPKPLMAAVNGSAVGIGFTMLLHCDIVFASEQARFRAPFTRMGVAPEAGSSFLLPRRMGRQHAGVALFTSDWISPDEAVAHGLAVKVCAPDTLLDDALALGAHIAEHPLASLMATKRLVIEADQEHIARARELEGAAFAELLQLPNARDRVAAQLDKQPAR